MKWAQRFERLENDETKATVEHVGLSVGKVPMKRSSVNMSGRVASTIPHGPGLQPSRHQQSVVQRVQRYSDGLGPMPA